MSSGLPLRADTVRCSWHIAEVAKGGRFGKSSKRRTPPAKISPTRCHGVPVSLFHCADSRNAFETKQRPACQCVRPAAACGSSTAATAAYGGPSASAQTSGEAMPAERQMRMTNDDAALKGADAPLHATVK